ncbi:MAG: glycosyltransferase family 4 protein, partial [Lachnospiraceae bacterium]|nr:glycosyltransferase family 4 protein [Lachnospiraceae bacterium]
MKIAVVCPSPVPFTIGGAENLAWGLCDAINKKTEHMCELIKLPLKEHSFWDLIDSYYAYYNLDLSHFDMVITTKYPSWMVRHDNSVCYMLHTLRGLYDTYHLCNAPETVPAGFPPVAEIIDYMEMHPNYEDLEGFFKLIFKLRQDPRTGCEKYSHYFNFPGPFIKKIIHYLDRAALTQCGMSGYYSISDTVKNRADYFPPACKVTAVYPPTVNERTESKDNKKAKYEHIFVASRLDSAKRIDMLIKAMKYVTGKVKLYIAGCGPCEEELKELAKDDSRIKFLGYVSKEELEKYYSDALVIPYFPYDEDYGYITVEAMLRKKPVITTKDSGGPNEFVKDNETGFSVDFDEKAIAEKIDYLVKNPDEAKRMGANGYKLVKDINWESAIEKLINPKPEPSDQKKLVVLSTFRIYPPEGGGRSRTFSLYKSLAKRFDVTLVSMDQGDQLRIKRRIAENMVEYTIPRSVKQSEEERDLFRKVDRIPVSDIAVLMYPDMTPDFN